MPVMHALNVALADAVLPDMLSMGNQFPAAAEYPGADRLSPVISMLYVSVPDTRHSTPRGRNVVLNMSAVTRNGADAAADVSVTVCDGII